MLQIDEISSLLLKALSERPLVGSLISRDSPNEISGNLFLRLIDFLNEIRERRLSFLEREFGYRRAYVQL